MEASLSKLEIPKGKVVKSSTFSFRVLYSGEQWVNEMKTSCTGKDIQGYSPRIKGEWKLVLGNFFLKQIQNIFHMFYMS